MRISLSLLFCALVSAHTAFANPCNSGVTSARQAIDPKNYDNCKKFGKAWVNEYKLKRHPLFLSSDMEKHVFRVEHNRENIECIDFMASRADHLTETELADLKRRNRQNISNALIAGQEKGKLTSEAIDTYKKLVEILKNPKTDKNRFPALSGCLLLIDERYEEIQRAYESLPKSPKPKNSPDTSPNRTEVI